MIYFCLAKDTHTSNSVLMFPMESSSGNGGVEEEVYKTSFLCS